MSKKSSRFYLLCFLPFFACGGEKTVQGSGLVTTSSCNPDSDTRLTASIGDLSQGPEITPIIYYDNGTVQDVLEGASVPLYEPPQGGRVIFIGVRARNLRACGARIEASIRDEANQKVQFDNRNINLVSTEDGWGGSVVGDIATFANIPLCPNNWSTTNIFNNSYLLTVTLTDQEDREVTVTRQVTPVCVSGSKQAACECFCKQGYELSETCSN